MHVLPCGRKKPKHPTSNSRKENSASDWKATLSNYLKEQGLRSTQQREKVAEIALNREGHFEVQTLIRQVQDEFPEISPATVYRSVKTLCDASLLTETLQSHTGVNLYEPSHDEHHDHIICVDCGEITEFHNESLEAAQDKAVQSLGFKPVSHQHVVYAKCSLLERKSKS